MRLTHDAEQPPSRHHNAITAMKRPAKKHIHNHETSPALLAVFPSSQPSAGSPFQPSIWNREKKRKIPEPKPTHIPLPSPAQLPSAGTPARPAPPMETNLQVSPTAHSVAGTENPRFTWRPRAILRRSGEGRAWRRARYLPDPPHRRPTLLGSTFLIE